MYNFSKKFLLLLLRYHSYEKLCNSLCILDIELNTYEMNYIEYLHRQTWDVYTEGKVGICYAKGHMKQPNTALKCISE